MLCTSPPIVACTDICDAVCSLQQDAQSVLEQAACHGKGISVKTAAVEALAVTTFVACNDPEVVYKCMTGFDNLCKSGMRSLITLLQGKVLTS